MRAFCQMADTPRYDLRIFSKSFELRMLLPSVLLPILLILPFFPVNFISMSVLIQILRHTVHKYLSLY
jgi:hypothetical protein